MPTNPVLFIDYRTNLIRGVDKEIVVIVFKE
jgi:hypothetical protein